MNGWHTTTLGEICLLITDGKHGDCANEGNSGFYFISAKDIRDGRINYEGARQIRETDFAETHRRTDLKPGDVLVTNSGTIGRLAVASDDERTFRTTFQKSVAILKPEPREISSRFLYYYLAANVDAFIHPAAGAAQKNLLLGDIRRFRISKPSLIEQERITGILCSYDDLIENNRRRIALLEEAARMLYREWFVRYRFPGHEHVKIIDGLPEGWVHGVVGDLFATSSGGTPSRQKPEYFGGYINWLKTQEMHNNYVFDTDEKITEDALKNSSAKLFSENTVLVAMYGATIGQLCILAKPSACNQACCALMPKADPKDYLFCYCLMESNARTLRDRGQGAAQNNVSQQVIKNFKLTLPKRSLVSLFNDSVEPLFNQRKNLEAQIALLVNARDLLLPRLMNGEIVV